MAERPCQFVPGSRALALLPAVHMDEREGQALPFPKYQNASLAAGLLKSVGVFPRVS